MSEYRTIKGKRHYVYELDEFEGDYVRDWRTAEEGDWVLSDDGRVLQILRKGNLRHPNNRKNYVNNNFYVRTVVGTFAVSEKSVMDTDFSKHPNRYTLSKKNLTANERFKSRDHLTSYEHEFVTHLVLGKTAIKAAMEAYGISDISKARKKAVVLMRQERIMSEVKKEIGDILDRRGIDDEFIIDGLVALFSQTSDLKVALNSLKELGKLTHTLGAENPANRLPGGGVVGLFQGFGNEEPKQIEE